MKTRSSCIASPCCARLLVWNIHTVGISPRRITSRKHSKIMNWFSHAHSGYWKSLAVFAGLTAICAPSLAELTPAGTPLPVTATLTYEDDGTEYAVTQSLYAAVGRVTKVELALPVFHDDVGSERTYPVTVRNAGNGPGTIRVGANSSYGWTVQMVADANQNGVRDPDENTEVKSLPNIAAEQNMKCLMVVKPTSANLPSGAQGTIWVEAADTESEASLVKSPFVSTYTVPLMSRFSFQTGSRLRSSPIVANDLVVTGSDDGVVWAVFANGPEAGTLAWRFPIDRSLGAPIVGRVAFDGEGFFFTAGSVAYNIDANGNLLWSSQVGTTGDKETESMPLITGDTVTLAGADGRIRRLNKQTGEVLEVSRPLGTGPLGTPALPGTGELWLGGSDGTMYALSNGGGYSVFASYHISNAGKSATPFVDNRSGSVLTVSAEGNVYSLSHRGQKTVWGPVALGSSVTAAPWVDVPKGIAYFAGTDNTIHALYTANGAVVPGYPVVLPGPGGFVGGPVVDPLPDGNRVLFVANTAGRIFALNTAEPYRYRMFDAGLAGSQFVGSPALSGASLDDVVVTACTNGMIYGFSVREAAAL